MQVDWSETYDNGFDCLVFNKMDSKLSSRLVFSFASSLSARNFSRALRRIPNRLMMWFWNSKILSSVCAVLFAVTFVRDVVQPFDDKNHRRTLTTGSTWRRWRWQSHWKEASSQKRFYMATRHSQWSLSKLWAKSINFLTFNVYIYIIVL